MAIAEEAEIQGDHLVLLSSTGALAALFVLEAVESWSVSGTTLETLASQLRYPEAIYPAPHSVFTLRPSR
jgi:hypothetical protein